jgi:DNA repair exonuclease SbcCD nuclease subunit
MSNTIVSERVRSEPAGGDADFCFVHAADLHLGGRRWLRCAPASRRLAQRVAAADKLALRSLVDLCLAERAALLLCAGDVLDGWCRDHNVGLELVQQLLRLGGACHVALVLGNHDARTRVMGPLLLPGHVHVLGRVGPETRILSELGVALHGWSFPEVSSATDVAALFPAPLTGLFNVGLLHTSAEGCRGHERYAPCSRQSLRRHGYQYWALGHVHTREVIANDPWIVFPGNLQGRGAREPGPRGASLVRVKGRQVESVEHASLDAVRFETLVVDTSSVGTFDDVLELARQRLAPAAAVVTGPPVIARLVLEGRAGAAKSLELTRAERAGALCTLARELASEHFWLDETWFCTDAPASAWRVDGGA